MSLTEIIIPVETLEETVPFMLSEDWQARFKGEYYQLRIRINKLIKAIAKEENISEKEVLHAAVPDSMLFRQLRIMMQYRKTLEARAFQHDIDLTTP